MIIRWLGAFRKASGLSESLSWELSQTERSAVAAERLVKGKSKINQAKIGLVVRNNAVLRKYRSDVYSEYNRRTGRLVRTRREGVAYSDHTECFVRPDYCAVVVKRGAHSDNIEVARAFAASRELPLLRLTRDGRLVNM